MIGSKVRNTGTRKVVHKLSFIGHVETEKNASMSKDEEAFSKKGKKQVEALTQKLLSNNSKYDHILVSSFWIAQNAIDPYLKSSNFFYCSISSYTD